MASTLGSTTSLQPNLVVPFADIAALLKNRLSDSELDGLLGQLIASRRRTVQAGDLITAEWAADIASRLAYLEGLGSGTPPAGNPKLLSTLLDTWDVFTNLEGRGEFLPNGADNPALRATVAISSAVRAVAGRASYAAGLSGGADAAQQLSLLQRLYQSERDMAQLFASDMPGAPAGSERQIFAKVMLSLLDDGSAGSSSMKSALDASDPEGARMAQDRINGVVMNQTGETTIGNIDVGYFKSTRGTNLIRNDTGLFGYVYRVTNKTNRTLTIQLEASFAAPKDGWTAFVTLGNGAGQALTLKPYDLNDPNSPAAFAEVTVNVRTPPGAAKGDTGVLQLRAFVPAPVNRGSTDSVQLTVDDQAANDKPNLIKFTSDPVLDGGSLDPAKTGDAVELVFAFKFTTTQAQKTRSFVFQLSSTKNLATFVFDCQDPPGFDTANTDATRAVTRSFDMTDQAGQSIKVVIVPDTGTVLGEYPFSASVKEVTGAFEIDQAQDFTINVKS